MERDSTAGGAEDLLLEDKVSKLASDHDHNVPELKSVVTFDERIVMTI